MALLCSTNDEHSASKYGWTPATGEETSKSDGFMISLNYLVDISRLGLSVSPEGSHVQALLPLAGFKSLEVGCDFGFER